MMTQDEIIEMARQAGINYRELSDEFATGNGDGVEIEQMEAFVKLVAAKEREVCAKVCDSLEEQCEKLGVPDEKWPTPADCAAVIRARGEA
jgi:hypothetical protein